MSSKGLLDKAVRTSDFMNLILTAVQEYDAAEYPQRVGRQKHLLDIDIHFADSRRGSRGRGRGGPRGRCGVRGAGGGSRNGAPGSRMGGAGDARGPGVSRFSELWRISYVSLRTLLFKIFHSKCLVLRMREILHLEDQAAGRNTVRPYIRVKYKNCQSQLNFDNYYMSDCTTCFGLTRPSSSTCIYRNSDKIIIHNNTYFSQYFYKCKYLMIGL